MPDIEISKGKSEDHSYYHPASEGLFLTNKPISEWECQLFGGPGLVWRPFKDEEPNRFWRWMQYLAFGNRWTKKV